MSETEQHNIASLRAEASAARKSRREALQTKQAALNQMLDRLSKEPVTRADLLVFAQLMHSYFWESTRRMIQALIPVPNGEASLVAAASFDPHNYLGSEMISSVEHIAQLFGNTVTEEEWNTIDEADKQAHEQRQRELSAHKALREAKDQL
jgi:hypothetical protein